MPQKPPRARSTCNIARHVVRERGANSRRDGLACILPCPEMTEMKMGSCTEMSMNVPPKSQKCEVPKPSWLNLKIRLRRQPRETRLVPQR
jgi:hypothetical protein